MTAAPLSNVMGLATALGLGLLIGLVRERAHQGTDMLPVAGLRTHAVLALLGAVGITLGTAVLVALLAGVALMTAVSYRRSSTADPGLTGEVVLLLTPLLGALAMQAAPLAAALGVVIAGLLQAKSSLHRFSRDLLTEEEVHDGLVLLAAALVVLPLLPNTPIDPWGVLRPQTLWRLVVLVMGVGMFGHVALRAVGVRWGLPLAGFLAGLVSSTAAVAGYGSSARSQPQLAAYAAAAALLANLASLLLMVTIIAALSPVLLRSAALPLTAAGTTLVLGSLVGLRGVAGDPASPPPPLRARSFQLGHAVLLAVAIMLVLLVAAIAQQFVGSNGAVIAAAIAALAEWHAAAASLAQMTVAQALTTDQATTGVILLLVASTIAKTAVAFASGGRRYGFWVGGGLLAMVISAASVAWLD